MNIGEANAANHVLRYVLELQEDGAGVDDERLGRDMELLAHGAHKTLMSGLTPEQVRRRWKRASK